MTDILGCQLDYTWNDLKFKMEAHIGGVLFNVKFEDLLLIRIFEA